MRKRSIALVLVLVLALLVLTACGSKPADASKSLVGSWVMDVEAYAKAMGQDISSPEAKAAVEAMLMTYSFSDNGKASVEVAGQSIATVDYTADGDKISMDASMLAGGATTGQKTDIPYRIDGTKLTLTTSAGELIFNKK